MIQTKREVVRMVGRKRGRGDMDEEISRECDNGHPMVLVPKEVINPVALVPMMCVSAGEATGEGHSMVLRWPCL